MDILDNVVPYISGEEEKMEPETRKILGHVNKDNMSFVQRSDLRVSATCTRVNVTDGHMAFVSLRFAKRPPPSAEQVKKAMREYVSDAQRLGCPSAPDPAITVLEQLDRPQPRLDRDVGRGYSVSVGRVREDKTGVFDLMFAALSHNSKSIPDFNYSVTTNPPAQQLSELLAHQYSSKSNTDPFSYIFANGFIVPKLPF